MLRIDFHSIARILLTSMKEADVSQMDFIYMIFSSFSTVNTDICFDNGLICKWLKGQNKVSPKIVNFYISEIHKKEMYADIEEELLPYISDIADMTLLIYNAVIADISISESKRKELIGLFNLKNNASIAIFISEILLFGMSRPFIACHRLSTSNPSPFVEDIILSPNIPKPISTFIGRSAELTNIHKELSKSSTLFILGIAGIGKSELLKEYMKQYRKHYTNILYMTYSNSLFQMITEMEFIDDANNLTPKELFRKHFRFLKTLGKDSLLVIDNFDCSIYDDAMLSQICDLKCNVIFTSTYNYNSYPHITLSSCRFHSKEVLEKFVPNISDYNDTEINMLLEYVDFHTMSVELIGRLLSYAQVTPSLLLKHLKNNVFLPTNDIKLSAKKDNKITNFLYQTYMESLLQTERLSKSAQIVLSVIALAPDIGIPAPIFYKWYGSCNNEVDELIDFGYLSVNCNTLSLHPYIRKLINAKKALHMSDCAHFYKNILISFKERDTELYPLLLNISRISSLFVTKDDKVLWKQLLIAALDASNTYHAFKYFSPLLGEYEYVCYMHSDINSDDYVRLEHFQAIESAHLKIDINKALSHEEKAINLAGKNGSSNILLFATLYLDASRYLVALGNSKKALEYLHKAYGILTNTQMQYNMIGISVFIAYAKQLYKNNQTNKAITIFEACIRITDAVLDSTSLTKGYLLQNTAAAYLTLKNTKIANLRFIQAISIFEKYFESDHPDIQICKEQQKSLLKDTKTNATAFPIPLLTEAI